MAVADHLQVPRQHGLFNHHGIDLGDGNPLLKPMKRFAVQYF